jgi:hypothetical protein
MHRQFSAVASTFDWEASLAAQGQEAPAAQTSLNGHSAKVHTTLQRRGVLYPHCHYLGRARYELQTEWAAPGAPGETEVMPAA